MYVYMYVCVCVCMYTMYVYMYVCVCVCIQCMCICMCMCMYTMYVYMYVCGQDHPFALTVDQLENIIMLYCVPYIHHCTARHSVLQLDS